MAAHESERSSPGLGSFGLRLLILRHLAPADWVWNRWGRLAGCYWSVSQNFLCHERGAEPNLGKLDLNGHYLRSKSVGSGAIFD